MEAPLLPFCLQKESGDRLFTRKETQAVGGGHTAESKCYKIQRGVVGPLTLSFPADKAKRTRGHERRLSIPGGQLLPMQARLQEALSDMSWRTSPRVMSSWALLLPHPVHP